MLRSIALAAALTFLAGSAFSQVFWDIPPRIPTINTFDRINLRIPGWADQFADSSIKKVLVPYKEPHYSQPSALPPGVRPTEYIGRDGLPGDPLPAVQEPFSRTIIWDKMMDLQVQDSVLIQNIKRILPREK